MSRLNHVKLVSPQPEVVDTFLREVCDIPAGWPLGEAGATGISPGARLGPGGELDDGIIERLRGPTDGGGYITGSTDSRQFQILKGSNPNYWAACISTRDIEATHERCKARGVPVTDIRLIDWTDRDDIRFFFCTVGGLTFEVMKVESRKG